MSHYHGLLPFNKRNGLGATRLWGNTQTQATGSMYNAQRTPYNTQPLRSTHRTQASEILSGLGHVRREELEGHSTDLNMCARVWV